MAYAVPVLKTIRLSGWQTLDPSTADKAFATLRDKPEMAPLKTMCQAVCPASRHARATAYLAGFGHPTVRAGTASSC